MKCKKHQTDLSSSVGVCASCLRDRLSAIINAQAQWKQQQAPISFPRSVSPYISQRKLNTTGDTWQLHGGVHRMFYSTPQVGPTASFTVEIKERKKKRFSSLFLGLFRSKSEKLDFDSVDSCSASPSWFSAIIPGRRRKKTIRTFSIDESAIGGRRWNRDRGMSPDEGEVHFHGGSSGYSSEQTPMRTPASTRRGGGRAMVNTKHVADLAFCLSPLVRASPNCHWNRKGIPPEMVVAGESRVTPKPHLSTTASFCKNRSRKLADFGRYGHNPTY